MTETGTIEETEKLMPEIDNSTSVDAIQVPDTSAKNAATSPTASTTKPPFPMSDLGSFMIRLDEDTKAAVYRGTNTVKYGNPAVLGLAGFGLTTMVLQFHNFGWIGLGPVIWLGLIFGGLAQLVAGFQEFCTGNNFGYSAFSTYGAFWIALALMLIGDHFLIYKTNHTERACFLLAFTFYTLIMWVGTFCLNVALCYVFGSLSLGFILLDIANFIPEELYDTTPSPRMAMATSGSIPDHGRDRTNYLRPQRVVRHGRPHLQRHLRTRDPALGASAQGFLQPQA